VLHFIIKPSNESGGCENDCDANKKKSRNIKAMKKKGIRGSGRTIGAAQSFEIMKKSGKAKEKKIKKKRTGRNPQTGKEI